MLDLSRPVQCTTALEVELLAALMESRRQLSRLAPKPLAPPKPKFRPPKKQPAPVVVPSGPRPLPAFKAGIKRIQLAVCKRFDITMSELLSSRRYRKVSLVRHVAVMLCYSLTQHSYPFIGRFFGERDHTTMLHSVTVLDKVRRELIAELNVADPLDAWVEAAYKKVMEGRANPPPEPVDPGINPEPVLDIAAERASFAETTSELKA